MTLLEDVIATATGEASVAVLLRQMKILAARTDTPVLATWVARELEGYAGVDRGDLPLYRGPFRMTVLAHFTGPFGVQVRNQQLHPMMFPEDLRNTELFNLWLRESVAELEQLSQRDDIAMTWPDDAEVMFDLLARQGQLNVDLNGMTLAQVRTHVSSHIHIGVLDAVRNRVLDLALTLERDTPQAGSSASSSAESALAATVINNYFHGTTSMAINGDATQLIVGLPSLGDREGLLRYLAAAGVAPEHLADLASALDKDSREDAQLRSPRYARARAWFTKQTETVGAGVATGLLMEAAKAFFGG